MYIIPILLFIIIILIIIDIKKKNNISKLSNKALIELNKELENNYNSKKENMLLQFSSLKAQKDAELREEDEKISQVKNDAKLYEARLTGLKENIETQKKANEETISHLESQLNSKRETIDLQLQNYYTRNYNDYTNQLQKILDDLREDSKEELDSFLNEQDLKIIEKRQELEEVKSEIEDYRKKRDVINNEILRQRQIAENQNFYRVCLSDEAKADIELLTSIMPRISKRESFNKLIYDTYIAKPVNEMIKRVLGSREPSGIYKITRLKTNEIYIGKSTNIHDRWQQHCKSAFHVGTISHSQLHTTMEQDGIENWTFEVVEECDKKDLTARESYWIKFYDSKNFGLNEKL